MHLGIAKLKIMQQLATQDDQEEACRKATEIERMLRKSGAGDMNWNTHRIHIFRIPIHPVVLPTPQHNDPSIRKGKKDNQKPCCACCNDCQHRLSRFTDKPAYARWDNYRACFVPCYREKAYPFQDAPMYYRYLGMNNMDSVGAWLVVLLVIIVFLVLLSADGFRGHGGHHDDHYHDYPFLGGENTSSPAMALWVLLIACGGLLLITICACGIYSVCGYNWSSDIQQPTCDDDCI